MFGSLDITIADSSAALLKEFGSLDVTIADHGPSPSCDIEAKSKLPDSFHMYGT